MKIKNLVRLLDQQAVTLKTFHYLATTHNLPFEKIAKFLIRLTNFRQKDSHEHWSDQSTNPNIRNRTSWTKNKTSM